MPKLKFEYDDSHPHYTPDWLSKRVAGSIPAGFRGVVIDPACGTGNLLAASALRLASGSSGPSPSFFGLDISSDAVAACRAAFEKIGVSEKLSVQAGDFLTTAQIQGLQSRRIVVMNPPFQGYGAISARWRDIAREELGLSGRFNLSHLFVLKAIREFSPEKLIAVLPSNWHFSTRSAFRDELDALGGTWTWRDVGDAFSGIAAHVGILRWSSRPRVSAPQSGTTRTSKAVLGYEVRQGVATGRDEIFREMAQLKFTGETVLSVVGRDVGRGSSRPIWIPSAVSERQVLRLPERIRDELTSRACVAGGKRGIIEYQENYPDWLLGSPKLLVPEIVPHVMRVELDRKGSKLPLHSVIAIRVPTIRAGEALRKYLLKDEVLIQLRRECPRLSGGAFRLNVNAIKRCIGDWHDEQ